MRRYINSKTILLILFAAVTALSHWVWFFDFGVISKGDWPFYFPETLSSARLSIFNVWYPSSYSFGDVLLSISQAPIIFLSGILSKFFNLEYGIIERLLYLWPLIIFSFLGIHLLLKSLLKNVISVYVGTAYFCFNTYFLTLQSGHVTLMVAFSLGPLILWLFMRSLEEKDVKNSVITGLVMALSAVYEIRAFLIIGMVVFFYFIFYSMVFKKLSFGVFIKNSALSLMSILIFFLLNAYWIIGLNKLGVMRENELFDRGLFGNNFMSLFGSFTSFHPFWTGAQLKIFEVQQVPLYFWLIPLMAIMPLFLKKERKNIVFFSFIAILGIFLTKQVNEPFSRIYPWLYENLPGFNAFREASKFYFLIIISYAVLFGYLTDWLLKIEFTKKYKNYLIRFFLLLVVILFLWNSKPLITREIGTLFVTRKIPSDYLVLREFIQNQNKYFRTLWIPADSRWGFYTNDNPKISINDVVSKEWSPFLFQDEKKKVSIDEKILAPLGIPASNNLLDISSIKYLIVPIRDKGNDDDFFIYYGGKEDENIRQYYIERLNQIEFIKKIDIGTKELAVYENENYRPHIYSTDEMETINESIPFKDIDFGAKSPTKYLISAKNVSSPFYLNFSEKFHPEWKLRAGKFSWLSVLIKDDYFLLDQNHIENDAKLNSFYLDPKEICEKDGNSSSCQKNADGSYNINLTLYFRPQSWFYLGLIISSLTLLGCLGYLGYYGVKTLRRKRNEKTARQ
jgi:hypothetical protein